MSKYMESVKDVAAYLRTVAEKNSSRPEVVSRVVGYADSLDEVADHIRQIEDLMTAVPPELGSISDLPQELLEELSVAKSDDLEDQIVTVINACDGEASLDQILVGLFRKFKVVQKRRFIQNKLYRMEMVWSLPGKKGVYTTSEPQDVDTVTPYSKTPYTSEQAYETGEEIPF